ncbi:PRC-barrel domain-containing protein [Oscillochloris sp. ZM17-4]|uniref:PRC-barrel domain-containing protein n=1 Tax=Oscillochloris sp. ZM17-4 TaxID=2866714 RepID=UPI001C736E3E|nr:PRC-barrel domain-containing protein [Oscillochloris sp. ZM17-4]MBX0330370.1 PRC-barrel domain-containing protein [Oscillochloris sp. ZM17-4]
MMQKINDLYGKPVIGQHTGNQIATVRDIVLDAEIRQIVALIIGGGWSGPEQVIRRERIIGVGEFIVADDALPFPAGAEDIEVAELRKNAERITGKKIISTTGEQIGTVGDIYFKDAMIVGFELKRGLFSGGEPEIVQIENVQAVGKDAVIAVTEHLVALSAVTAQAVGDGDPAIPPAPIAGEPLDEPASP